MLRFSVAVLLGMLFCTGCHRRNLCAQNFIAMGYDASDAPALSAQPATRTVTDEQHTELMASMPEEGYTLLGVSEFTVRDVRPGYGGWAVRWGMQIGAEHVVLSWKYVGTTQSYSPNSWTGISTQQHYLYRASFWRGKVTESEE